MFACTKLYKTTISIPAYVGFVFIRLFTYLEPAPGIWLIYHLSNLHPPKKIQTNLYFFYSFLMLDKLSYSENKFVLQKNHTNINIFFFFLHVKQTAFAAILNSSSKHRSDKSEFLYFSFWFENCLYYKIIFKFGGIPSDKT